MNTKNLYSIVFRLEKNPKGTPTGITTYWDKYHNYKTLSAAEQALRDLKRNTDKNDWLSSKLMRFKIVDYFKGSLYKDKT